MTLISNLGFPRIGRQRELKKALEAFWAGRSSAEELENTAKVLRETHWRAHEGFDHIPSNDFALYDQVLDHAELFGIIPDRYKGTYGLTRSFAMARGLQNDYFDLTALEMTKWFDSNYHYLVPEISEDADFKLNGNKPLSHLREARSLGIATRPVLIGPVTLLLLSKVDGARLLRLIDRLLPLYAELLRTLKGEGVSWIQMDEPCLVTDLSLEAQTAYKRAYNAFAGHDVPKILLTTYFGALGDNLNLVTRLPVQGLHIDLVRAPEQLDAVLEVWPQERYLSAGVIDGRNIWRSDLDAALKILQTIKDQRGSDRLIIAPSCSLLHSPVDLKEEKRLDPVIRSWLAFATQKLDEIRVLRDALDAGHTSFRLFSESRAAIQSRAASTRVNDPAVGKRIKQLTAAMSQRQNPYPRRREAQKALGLPPFPTTTIGSFPQTAELRSIRASYKAGRLQDAAYKSYLAREIEQAVRWQEEVELDVLVHGEFERNDMVEYFGEQLAGFCFTENGWVQSYGSRCVKPPIIYGDVSRPKPMTVEWSSYAQSLTKRPMKGMLTGPVTILQWSFVRCDQPRETTCRQIALAIRDEVHDLEKAGLRVIQIDEPAIREGLPLRHTQRSAYLSWAVECFRISASGVEDGTQIHTHMCYSDFNDIIEAVAALDADAVSIETSRSHMELLDAFARYRYPSEVGPGVYDIHSPRVPTEDEMLQLLRKAAEVLPAQQIWVNPDCGLKTRAWAEVKPALASMVKAAKRMRQSL